MDQIYLNNPKYLNLLNINSVPNHFLRLALFAGSTIKKLNKYEMKIKNIIEKIFYCFLTDPNYLF